MSIMLKPCSPMGLRVLLCQERNPFALSKFGCTVPPIPTEDTAMRKNIGLTPFSPAHTHFILEHPPSTETIDLDQMHTTPTKKNTQASTPAIAPATTVTTVTVPDTSAITTPSKKTRRVKWTDDSGNDLCKEMPFYRWDEPWRCSPTQTRYVHPGSANADEVVKRPSLEFDRSCLLSDREELAEAVEASGVKLESLLTRHPLIFLTIRVLNIAFEKEVRVRFTTDNWATYTDIPADFIPSCVDFRADRFYASITVPMRNCDSMQFALSYTCEGKTFWDNNNGKNYTVKVNMPSQTTADLLKAFSTGVSPFVLSR